MNLDIAVCTPVARAAMAHGLRQIEGVHAHWTDAGELAQAADRCDALVLPAADYTPELADALAREGSRCRWLQLLSAGYETLTMHGVPRGIEVSNAGSVWSPLVAEHAIGLLLALVRRLPRILQAQAGAHWNGALRNDMSMLYDAHLVIVGLGSIGGELAKRARAFGMRVTGVNRSGRAHPEADSVISVARLHEALAEADFIALAVPGSPASRGLFGSRELACCRPGAVLVNVGRGSVVDTDALVQALRERSIAGAALDVTEPEPLPDGHPLWSLPNVIVSPHLGGAAPERYNERLVRHVVANVRARVSGLPLADRVDPRETA